MMPSSVVVTADVRTGHGCTVITRHWYKRSELTEIQRSPFRLNFRVPALDLN